MWKEGQGVGGRMQSRGRPFHSVTCAPPGGTSAPGAAQTPAGFHPEGLWDTFRTATPGVSSAPHTTRHQTRRSWAHTSAPLPGLGSPRLSLEWRGRPLGLGGP